VNQVEIHPLLTQDTLVKWSQENGILISAYCPLGGQSLEGQAPPVLQQEVILKIAQKYNKSAAHVTLRWAIQRGINPLPKSAKQERIASNFDIFDFELTADEVKAITALNKNDRFNDPATWGPSWLAIFA